mgnify:CR=1 FL=1
MKKKETDLIAIINIDSKIKHKDPEVWTYMVLHNIHLNVIVHWNYDFSTV